MFKKKSPFFKSLFLITLTFIIGGSRPTTNSEDNNIDEKYLIKGNKVYFTEAESKLINGDRIFYTNFRLREPAKSDRIKHNAWMDSYRNYHMDEIAIPRLNFFMSKEGLDATKLAKYEFMISGYYADFEYQVDYESDGSASIYGTPIVWHERQ